MAVTKSVRLLLERVQRAGSGNKLAATGLKYFRELAQSCVNLSRKRLLTLPSKSLRGISTAVSYDLHGPLRLNIRAHKQSVHSAYLFVARRVEDNGSVRQEKLKAHPARTTAYSGKLWTSDVNT